MAPQPQATLPPFQCQAHLDSVPSPPSISPGHVFSTRGRLCCVQGQAALLACAPHRGRAAGRRTEQGGQLVVHVAMGFEVAKLGDGKLQRLVSDKDIVCRARTKGHWMQRQHTACRACCQALQRSCGLSQLSKARQQAIDHTANKVDAGPRFRQGIKQASHGSTCCELHDGLLHAASSCITESPGLTSPCI